MTSKPRLCSRRDCNDEAEGFSTKGDLLCLDHLTEAELASDIFDDDAAERDREAFMQLARAH